MHFSATARLMSDALRCIVLRGAGLEVHVAPLGATLVKVLTPDRTGAVADVALGYDTASAYKQASTYFGAVVGRCANRIAQGRFSLGGLSYLLACNNPPNALHGGPTGFHVREWAVEALLDGRGVPLPAGGATDVSPAGVRLAYTSAAGEEGYPGELSVSVTYLLREDDGRGEGAEGTADAHPSLLTRFSARVRGDETIVNLAQHCYWNLGGHDSGSVLGSHSLRLNSSFYTPVDDTLIPDGRLASVANTPFDFTQPVQLGLHAAEVPGGRGFDHNFVLMGPNGAPPFFKMRRISRASSPQPCAPPARLPRRPAWRRSYTTQALGDTCGYSRTRRACSSTWAVSWTLSRARAGLCTRSTGGGVWRRRTSPTQSTARASSHRPC